MKRIVLMLLAVGVTSVYAQQTSVVNVNSERFRVVMDSIKDEVIIDLRTPEEVAQGTIPGAIVIDFFGQDFEPAINRLSKDKTYMLYCASGARSGETIAYMQQRGFKKIYHLQEGFKGWRKKKMPIALR